MNITATPGPWANRWADLPLMGGKVELPAYDGDMAELHELRDRVLATVATGGRIPVGPRFGAIHHDVVRASGIDNSLFFPSINPWPPDLAGELLAAWRSQTGEKAVAA